MGRIRKLSRAAALLSTVAILWTGMVGVAAATTLDPDEVDISDFVDAVVVDDVNRWFIAHGAAADKIAILTLDGDPIGEITGLDSIGQLNHDPVRRVVWVTLNAADQVVAFDDVTGAAQTTFDLPGHCPSGVAAINDILAVGSSCGAGTARINLLDETVTLVPEITTGNTIESVVTQPNRIVSLHDDTVRIVGFNGPATQVFKELDVPGAHDIALSDDGNDIAIASVDIDVHGFPQLETHKYSYTPPGGAFAIEFAPDGSLVAVDGDANLLGYKPTSSDPYWEYPLGGVDPILGSLEIASDASVYLLVTTDPGGGDDGDVVTPGGDPPVVGVDPGSISGEVEPDPLGPPPTGGTELLAELYDADWNLLGTAVAGLDFSYEFAPVNPGSYYLVFSAVNNGVAAGYFPEIHSDKPVLLSQAATPIVVAEGQAYLTGEATLRPFYTDMVGSIFAADIYWLANSGITKGCNPPLNTLFCGSAPVTRGQMAAFLSRAMLLPEYTGPGFIDDDNSVFEADIEALAAAGITKGCNPPVNDKFCPDSVVTRGQMAAFLSRAFALTDTGTTDFVDDDDSEFETEIEKLAASGITKGCNPPVNDQFCPDAPVTRVQMAAFLNRAFLNAADTAIAPPKFDVEPSGIAIRPI